jgi:hypothetical protein
LQRIKIPDKVTNISYDAFGKCSSLKNIEIPQSVISILSHAFCNCKSLKNIKIPSSVTTIENYVFDYCPSLESIIVEAGNPAYKSVDGVLFNKDQTHIIRFPQKHKSTGYIIPNTVIYVLQHAFQDCISLENVIIPKSVKSLGRYAFSGCKSLENILIPKDAIIGYNAFMSCPFLQDTELQNRMVGGPFDVM